MTKQVGAGRGGEECRVLGRGRSAVSCEDRAKVQIGAELLCKGGKVGAEKSTDYRVRSSEYRFGRHEVGAWLCRALLG